MTVAPIELPGHGATPLGGAFSIEAFAAHVLAALDAAGVARAALFGYSMGGYVALHLAGAHPARIAAVVTLGTKLDWTPEVAAREAARLDPAALRARVPRFAEALAVRHARGLGWEPLLARTADLLRGLGDRPLLTPDVLAAIACPVRLMIGDRDATVPLEECAAAHRALARGELAVLPGTPHPLEQVDLTRLAREIAEVHARTATAA